MENGTDRGDREVISGSAPFVATSEPLPALTFQPLRFDAREFMQFIEDEDFSEKEAEALLRAYWDVVVSFVDIRFGLNPVQQALVDRSRRAREVVSGGGSAVVSSKDEFSKIANRTTVRSASRAGRRRKDS